MLEAVLIPEGRMKISDTGENLQALLQTGVAVCVFDKKSKVGALLHFAFPDAQDPESPKPSPENACLFGSSGIPHLLKQFKLRGAKPEDLQVMLFGGFQSSTNLGHRNANLAKTLVQSFGLPITKRSLEQSSAEMIIRFDTKTGEVFLKKVAVAIPNRIRVLIVDDSAPIRKIIRSSLEKFPDVEVVGDADNTLLAETMRTHLKPDVMTLDLHMPLQDGLEYLRSKSALDSTAVVIVSDLSLKEVSPVMEALELGAFDYLQKPRADEISHFGEKLIEVVRAAHQFKIKADAGLVAQKKSRPQRKFSQTRGPRSSARSAASLIALGASTGGTEALREVLSQLPSETPPILIVQHMPAGFTAAFAQSLNHCCDLNVKEAQQGDILNPNTAYIAPGGKHMRIVERDSQFIVQLNDDAPVNRFKPSVDVLFRSLTQLSRVKAVRAALLTGMGNDGAQGLLELRQKGALTIAQDEATSVVFGMPKSAIEMDAASIVLSLEDIGPELFPMKQAS